MATGSREGTRNRLSWRLGRLSHPGPTPASNESRPSGRRHGPGAFHSPAISRAGAVPSEAALSRSRTCATVVAAIASRARSRQAAIRSPARWAQRRRRSWGRRSARRPRARPAAGSSPDPPRPRRRPRRGGPRPRAPRRPRPIEPEDGRLERRSRARRAPGSTRSAASVYCTRSFVPMLKKSATSARPSATIAAAGTSIMTPSRTADGGGDAPHRRSRRAGPARRRPPRPWRPSAA